MKKQNSDQQFHDRRHQQRKREEAARKPHAKATHPRGRNRRPRRSAQAREDFQIKPRGRLQGDVELPGTPPPRSIGIIGLAENRKIIQGAQSLTGKILMSKNLTFPNHLHLSGSAPGCVTVRSTVEERRFSAASTPLHENRALAPVELRPYARRPPPTNKDISPDSRLTVPEQDSCKCIRDAVQSPPNPERDDS